MKNKIVSILPELKTLIEKGYVVPIIGREILTVSYKGREMLLYTLIAEKLAEVLNISAEGLAEGEEINTVVRRHLAKGKKIDEIYRTLYEVIPSDDEISIPESLLKLADIRGFKLFVSTTFDNLLERAINQVRSSGEPETSVIHYAPNRVQDLPKSIIQLDRPTIYHLFGKITVIPEYAVTQEDTLEWIYSLQSDSLQPKILFDELSYTNLLLLGCSFGNWLVRFFLRTAKRKRLCETRRGYKEYLADDLISSDSRLVVFLRSFSPDTEILEGINTKDFINELHEQCDKYSDPKTKVSSISHSKLTTDDIGPGAVFLSYSSSDRSAAIKIKDALKKAGVEVFFDKDNLRVGDKYDIRIKRIIKSCSLFIPVISKTALARLRSRPYFQSEWNTAINEAKKAFESDTFILPVAIDDTSCEAEKIPEKFREPHWAKLPDGQTSPDFVDRVRELYRQYQKEVVETT